MGISMLFTMKKGKSMLLLAIVLCSMASCKQSEFYDKAQLLDANKQKDGSSEPDPVKTDGPSRDKSDSVDDNIVVFPPEVTPPMPVLPPVRPPEEFVLLEPRSELFIQNTVRDGDVDVLFMIDNSGSMANKQKRLSESLGLFIDKFLDKKINFKMAITTSDGTKSRSGKMIGDSNKLTSDYLKLVGKNQFMNYFSQMTKVGIDGSGVEQGLKTSAAFFDRYHSSFLRNDAYLALVEISDEDDQSEKAVKDYVAKFQALKKNKGMLKVYSIVSLRLPMDNTLSDSIGEHYLEATQMTGGTSSEIKDDFSSILSELGTSIANLVESFSLTDAPYNGDIQVYVNQILVQSGWSYNAISHSIKFDTTNIPSAGSQIEIRYKVKAKIVGAI